MLDHRLVGSAAHVLVSDLDEPRLGPDDRHHLFRVLRLRPGESVTLTDGAGKWRMASVQDEDLRLDSEILSANAPRRAGTVGFALTKGQRPDLVIQKLTELGTTCIAPFVARRSIVRWDSEKGAAQVDRWRRIAAEALMQSRGVWLPEIREIETFDQVMARWPGAALADMAGPSLPPECSVLLVGPEGGWDPAELEGRTTFRLGDTVLRAETAAIVAGALLSRYPPP